MKSVCIVVQSVYDLDPRVRRKAEALVGAGYSVDVLALRGSGAGRPAYVLNGVNVMTISLGKKRGSLVRYLFEYVAFFVWVFLRVPWLMRRRRYVVIDVNTLPDFLIFAPMVARWMGAKLILDMHEITPEFYMSKYGIGQTSWLIRLLEYVERISFDFADGVVTINEPILELLVGRGLSRSRATVVMNAVDEARFASGAVAPSRGEADFVMVYHGTLTRIYGLDIAIEAFALAHRDMPGAELWILGSGPEQHALATLARDRGVTSAVKLVGQVPAAEIPGWLSRCDVGILPIRRDVFLDFAFPNKLPEFIIAGKAVLVSRLGAIRHYFSEDAVAFCEPNNPADLAVQMKRLYGNAALRAALVRRAREEYAPIRWDLMKARYLEFISRVADPLHGSAKSSSVATRTDLAG